MKRLIEIIYNNLLNGKTIPDEIIYEFSQETKEIVRNRAVVDIPSEFWNFQNYIEMFWRGRKYETADNTALIYQMGQLLSYVNMIRDIADEDERVLSLDEYVNHWEKKYPVFKGIHDESGINHKKLAEVSGLTPSALSQFIAKTKWDGFFIFRNVGREKYYYLTEEGEKLYELMKERQTKEPEEPRYFFVSLPDDNNYINRNVYKLTEEAAAAFSQENAVFDILKMFGRHSDIPYKDKCVFGDKKIVKETLYAESGNSFK